MVRVPSDREPVHPGEILLEEFLRPMGMSQRRLALEIRLPYRRVNELVNGKRGVTPAMGLRLARFFGTSVGLWTNLQQRWDLWQAQRSEAEALKKIRPMRRPVGS